MDGWKCRYHIGQSLSWGARKRSKGDRFGWTEHASVNEPDSRKNGTPWAGKGHDKAPDLVYRSPVHEFKE